MRDALACLKRAADLGGPIDRPLRGREPVGEINEAGAGERGARAGIKTSPPYLADDWR